MYCTKCGKLASPEDQFCNGCGNAIVSPEAEKKESIVLAILALVFSVLCPIVGLHLGLVGLEVYKSKKNRDLSALGVIVSVSIFIVLCAITMLLFYFI